MIVQDKSYRALTQVRNSNVIISVGFGVLAEPKVSIRLAAYLLPAIQLYDLLLSQANTVSLRIYFAKQAASLTLGRDYEPTLVREWIKQTQNYLQRFIQAFRGDVKVKFYKDLPWNGKLGLALHSLCQRKWPERIHNRLSRFPNPKISLRYWAAHSLYMLTPLDIPWCPVLENEDQPPEGSVVAVINGPQEGGPREVIGILRHEVGVHERWKTFHVSTPIGRLPVYAKTEADIFVSDLISMDAYALSSGRYMYEKDAFHDLGALLAYACGVDYEQRETEEAWTFGLEELQSRI